MKVALLLLLALVAVSLVSASTHHQLRKLKPRHHRAPVHATRGAIRGATHRGSDACNGDDYGTAGQFDFYVFEQSWPAQFCQDHSSYPGCEEPTAWQQANLTLHGMWPNYNQEQDGHSWPQCCDSTYGNSVDTSVVEALLPELQTYWPNEQDPSGGTLSSSLWAHEWQKHGTCSNLPQKEYFQQAMDIELGMPTPSAITNNIGGSAQLSDLYAAYNANDCSEGGDCLVGFSCSDSYLSSVTTCWDTNFSQITCPSAVFSDACTDSQVSIQSFSS